jgi:hypothetical protein
MNPTLTNRRLWKWFLDESQLVEQPPAQCTAGSNPYRSAPAKLESPYFRLVMGQKSEGIGINTGDSVRLSQTESS